VLESGVMPLALLEKKIDAWIAKIKLQIIAIKLSLRRKLFLDKKRSNTLFDATINHLRKQVNRTHYY
jgi:hypothetical protein